METIELKIGDRIYRLHYNEIVEIMTIKKITKTMAITGINKFRINIDKDGRCQKIGSNSSWYNSSYYIETPELKEKLIRQKNIRIIQNFDLNKLSAHQIDEIIKIIKNEK